MVPFATNNRYDNVIMSLSKHASHHAKAYLWITTLLCVVLIALVLLASFVAAAL